ncbi:hypothetical protein [Fischerella sp. PCC 9605]|uniref:hypothetical protein n=1 Tax=Fischerella sp. PCC 9605 TaxID=1173024 RepID=UPI0012DEEB1C|nr:hypothetical protein [Fischerella sp. PCC 9605]
MSPSIIDCLCDYISCAVRCQHSKDERKKCHGNDQARCERTQFLSPSGLLATSTLTVENSLLPKSKGTQKRKKVQHSCIDEQSFFKACSQVRLLKGDRHSQDCHRSIVFWCNSLQLEMVVGDMILDYFLYQITF